MSVKFPNIKGKVWNKTPKAFDEPPPLSNIQLIHHQATNWYAASVYYLPTHQFEALLEVDWPDDQEVTDGEDEQQ